MMDKYQIFGYMLKNIFFPALVLVVTLGAIGSIIYIIVTGNEALQPYLGKLEALVMTAMQFGYLAMGGDESTLTAATGGSDGEG